MSFRGKTRLASFRPVCLLGLALLLLAIPAHGLITGGLSNAPVRDQDWPAGALELANLSTRMGYWEGPPFGGGEFHFLYRGDTAVFQDALDRFAKILSPERHVLIREGTSEGDFDSSILQDPQKPDADSHVDWSFVVWTPRSWHSLYNDPQSVWSSEDEDSFRNPVPSPTLVVNLAETGAGGIDWSKIKIPAGLNISDERATIAGYTRDDGSVLRGNVYDLVTSKPLAGAQITLGTPTKGQNAFDIIARTRSDAVGHFELKHVPEGDYRISVSAEGHVARAVGYESFGKNTLRQHIVQLAAPITVRGVVKTTDGKRLPNVKVRTGAVLALDGRGYQLSDRVKTVTDAHGNFELAGLPEGYFQFFATDDTHAQLDVLRIYGAPYDNIALVMTVTGTVKGKVVTPNGHLNLNSHVFVSATGDHPTNWSGTTRIGPDGSFEFTNVPPGKYLLSTEGPPESNDPAAKLIEVKAGEAIGIQLTK